MGLLVIVGLLCAIVGAIYWTAVDDANAVVRTVQQMLRRMFKF